MWLRCAILSLWLRCVVLSLCPSGCVRRLLTHLPPGQAFGLSPGGLVSYTYYSLAHTFCFSFFACLLCACVCVCVCVCVCPMRVSLCVSFSALVLVCNIKIAFIYDYWTWFSCLSLSVSRSHTHICLLALSMSCLTSSVSDNSPFAGCTSLCWPAPSLSIGLRCLFSGSYLQQRMSHPRTRMHTALSLCLHLTLSHSRLLCLTVHGLSSFLAASITLGSCRACSQRGASGVSVACVCVCVCVFGAHA